jgi:hypothetical protein
MVSASHSLAHRHRRAIQRNQICAEVPTLGETPIKSSVSCLTPPSPVANEIFIEFQITDLNSIDGDPPSSKCKGGEL